jgi:hypothetical protein
MDSHKATGVSMQLPLRLSWELAQDRWKTILQPLLDSPTLQGNNLTGIALINGSTTVNHLLGRVQQGWILTDVNGAATIYRSGSFNATSMVLVSNAAVTVNIYVF